MLRTTDEQGPWLETLQQQMLKHDITRVLYTQGEAGMSLVEQSGSEMHINACASEVFDVTGAGDSFAGGFLGHIGRKNSIDQKTLKEAVIYGNVMGSFAVEDFGINKFLTITNETIEERYKIYREFLTF